MDLGEAFENFRFSAKRVESLQEYKIEGQEWDCYQDWLRGLPVSMFDDLKDWSNLVEKWHRQGKIVERVRVAKENLSPYLRFEIEMGYLPLVCKGQNVFFVSEGVYKKNNLGLFQDFWIFDDKIAFGMKYDSSGQFIGSEEIDVKQAVEVYEVLKNEAISLDEVSKQIRGSTVNLKFE